MKEMTIQICQVQPGDVFYDPKGVGKDLIVKEATVLVHPMMIVEFTDKTASRPIHRNGSITIRRK